MAVAEQVNQDAFEDLDAKAATAIQQGILGKIATRQEKQKEQEAKQGWLKRIIKAGAGSTPAGVLPIAKINSAEFRDNLEKWEPWKLDEKSVGTGKNLHMRIAKAYASKDFKDWLTERSASLAVQEDELLAGTLEIIRHFEWETIKFLLANGEDVSRTSLPFTVINVNPGKALHAAIENWSSTRGISRYADEAQRARAILGFFEPESQEHEPAVEMGRSILGTASAYFKPLAISSNVVTGCFDRFIEDRVGYQAGYSAEFGIWDLGYVVAEETLHNLGYKHMELRSQSRAKEKEIDEPDPKLRGMLSREVPIHEHINEVAKKISTYCTDKYGDSFMDPLRNRIGEIGTLRSTFRNPPGAI